MDNININVSNLAVYMKGINVMIMDGNVVMDLNVLILNVKSVQLLVLNVVHQLIVALEYVAEVFHFQALCAFIIFKFFNKDLTF